MEGSPNPSVTVSSTRSSPPRNQARALARAWRSCTRSWSTNTTAGCRSRSKTTSARRFESGFRGPDVETNGYRPRVVFVDDEPDVLAGLRTSLRRDRKRFEFVFAEGASQALELLSEDGADIVVSDMRMPGMNGVEFLSEVAVRHPDAVRIVLSGEPGSDLVIQAMAVCHQWLSKPCDRETVLASLEASVRFRRLMADPTIAAAVCQADPLPTAPRMYQELKALATSPDVSATQIADLASSDAALAAKVLQLANSAFVGRTPVMTIRDAIVRVGVEHLVLLVLSTELLRGVGTPTSISPDSASTRS